MNFNVKDGRIENLDNFTHSVNTKWSGGRGSKMEIKLHWDKVSFKSDYQVAGLAFYLPMLLHGSAAVHLEDVVLTMFQDMSDFKKDKPDLNSFQVGMVIGKAYLEADNLSDRVKVDVKPLAMAVSRSYDTSLCLNSIFSPEKNVEL